MKSNVAIFPTAGRLVAGRLWTLAAYSLAFKGVNLILLAPLAAWMLHRFLQRWGRASVGNFEIASFLLSPIGLAAICIVGAVLTGTRYLEVAGLMRLMAERELRWWQAWQGRLRLTEQLLRLGVLQLAVTVILALPFVLAVSAIYRQWWHGRDLNGLFILKPPEFWWGFGLACGVVSVFVLAVLLLYLSWLLAVPCLLCEQPMSPRRALTKSRHMVRGHLVRVVVSLLIWFTAQTIFALCAAGISQHWLLQVLEKSSDSLSGTVLATASVLSAQWFVGVLVSVVADIGFSAVVLGLYCHITDSPQLIDSRTAAPNLTRVSLGQRRPATPVGWIVCGTILLACVGSATLSSWIFRTLSLHESVELTAHRAGAGRAPENTLAAIEQAIVDQAQWSEIDVQLTADAELVVTHDTDLARIGGGAVPVAQATLAEIQALDVGKSMGTRFVGEHVPKFSDVLERARDRMRLNVELKPHGAQDAEQLTRRVVAEIQNAHMTRQCRICSQSYESIQLAKALEPQLQIGFIAGASVGDVTQLKVDFLMLSRKSIDANLVRRARAKGISVHAWTINDSWQVAPLLDAGVANIITDDVVRIRYEVRAIEALPPVDRLLLRTKHALVN